MRHPGEKRIAAAIGVLLLAGATAAGAASKPDRGVDLDKALNNKAMQLFGVNKTLDSSSTTDLTAAQIQSDPASVATLAKGLTARVVSATQTGVAVDMMALWPNATNPQWLIACNESGQNDVERINISTGAVEVLFTGTNSCDGVRRTPWGTVVVSEEAGGFASAADASRRRPRLRDPRSTCDDRGQPEPLHRRLQRRNRSQPRGGSASAGAALVRGICRLRQRRHVLR